MSKQSHPVVGVWLVKAEGAPVKYHVFAFHEDGIMTQTNPEAGNREKSDSIGKGPWAPDAPSGSGAVRAKFVEVSADRQTGQFVSRGEIHFRLTVDGDRLTGSSEANFFDEQNRLINGPLSSAIEGTRITI